MSINFIGVDAGGTSTRALLATAAGEVVGHGRAAGANAWSSGTAPADTIAAAIRDALGAHAPSSVASGVIAVAGGASSVPAMSAGVVSAWHALGLAAEPRIILDVVAAYAAGTPLTRGLVLAAGTGAVAALVDDGALVRRAGGRGWLVGDEGSAVWLGTEGVRAALLALDARGPATSLTDEMTAALGVEVGARADIATSITDAVYSRAPAELGRLAPLVVGCAEAGDAVAEALVDGAAQHLVETAAAAAGASAPAVVVLAGSLLIHAATLRERVRADLQARWPQASFAASTSGEAGATALAIRWHTERPVSGSVLEALRAGSVRS